MEIRTRHGKEYHRSDRHILYSIGSPDPSKEGSGYSTLLCFEGEFWEQDGGMITVSRDGEVVSRYPGTAISEHPTRETAREEATRLWELQCILEE